MATKTREVGESGDEIQLLSASIESSEAAVSAHEEKLEGVAADLAKWSAQKEPPGQSAHFFFLRHQNDPNWVGSLGCFPVID